MDSIDQKITEGLSQAIKAGKDDYALNRVRKHYDEFLEAHDTGQRIDYKQISQILCEAGVLISHNTLQRYMSRIKHERERAHEQKRTFERRVEQKPEPPQKVLQLSGHRKERSKEDLET